MAFRLRSIGGRYDLTCAHQNGPARYIKYAVLPVLAVIVVASMLIHRPFCRYLCPLLKECYRECVWHADAYENRELTADDFVFRKHDSRDPMAPSTFTWWFKLILKKNGLPEKLNVHSLHHSNASLLIAGGADVATVAGLLGHSQPSTTLDIYTHAFDKKAASETLQRGLDI